MNGKAHVMQAEYKIMIDPKTSTTMKAVFHPADAGLKAHSFSGLLNRVYP